MRYFYQILRFHIANQHHIRTRNKINTTWHKLGIHRRKLRCIENERLEKNLKLYKFKETNSQNSS